MGKELIHRNYDNYYDNGVPPPELTDPTPDEGDTDSESKKADDLKKEEQ